MLCLKIANDVQYAAHDAMQHKHAEWVSEDVQRLERNVIFLKKTAKVKQLASVKDARNKISARCRKRAHSPEEEPSS